MINIKKRNKPTSYELTNSKIPSGYYECIKSPTGYEDKLGTVILKTDDIFLAFVDKNVHPIRWYPNSGWFISPIQVNIDIDIVEN